MSAFANHAYHDLHGPTVADHFGFTERDVSKLRDDMRAAAVDALQAHAALALANESEGQ